MKKLLAILMFAALGPQLFGADLRSARKIKSETIRSLRVRYNLPKITFDFGCEDIVFQTYKYPTKLSFQDAAIRAVNSFIHDTGTNKELLSIVIGDVGQEAGEKYIHNLLNSNFTIFGLVNEDSAFRAVNGEKSDKNWIFYLIIDGLNIIFWAIVDREGTVSTYNYGY